MKSTLVVLGHGPGISHSVARHFGKLGHPVAIVARSEERLLKAAAELSQEGINAHVFAADLQSQDAVVKVTEKVREKLGPIGILHWNAYSPVEGSILEVASDDLNYGFSIRVVSFITAVQACIEDLEATCGAVLATSGVMALSTPEIDAFSVEYGALAIGAAAQHKACGILAKALQPRGVYVGELIVNGFVKGTEGAFDQAATLDPDDIADAFGALYSKRIDNSVVFGRVVNTMK
ncbi:SDR family NAD(P)-dependent oxidoreductase [Pseudomonas aeruginosa]|uniref:SDR family NAD(P)-dependent oxidoreductase n=1 Tax=Pseudomonas aeruginosa TaxID=287 RepID=UPI001A3541A5|nr:SDR family NAD(P)-dependent oxidoreductase [Pseudomonas aeruginosa]MBG7464642.1 SDR family NAD(P)-dependent oxidoreductase [Pseudomonas aeruginosa]MDG3710734.1 SDR family NAD(P)-dependent oxidoreductase [Pseudomonas aeruginosa]HBO3623441.1 SDR family NAD(P)-dependent oxidoreductase [Pseudomonas aeruginosa]HCF5590247.1 SDR family NAD(P)-dependent oxidoreductase [Pseudomonas aeruginosa]